MKIAKSIVKTVEIVPIAPESVSREALIDDMAQNRVDAEEDGKDISYWQSSAFVGELEQFFGGRHINQQMVNFLTAIWDEDSFKERTRKGGEVIIRNPYFTLLGCCTPSWMNEKLKSDVISDGFSRRAIFCLENEPACLNAWPTLSDDEIGSLASLIPEASRINKIKGRFVFTKPAREYWDERYYNLRQEAKHHTEKMRHYFTSKHDLAMKVSMCVSAGIRDDRVIDSEILKIAYKFLDTSERHMDKVFSGVGQNALKAIADKMLERIRQAGTRGIERRQLLAASYDEVPGGLKDFDEVITVLEQQGLIKLVSLTISEPPRYLAEQQQKQSEVVNLLELASRITPIAEELMKDLELGASIRPAGPIKTKLEVRQEQRNSDLERRVLIRGMIAQSVQSLHSQPKSGLL